MDAPAGPVGGATVILALLQAKLKGRSLARALEQGYAQSLQMEAEHQRIAANTPDAVEGATAFLQRRPAVFGGQ